ncbi:MAG: hypothetical protein JSS82_03285 [Bacteroidetes bacterium]|nr:hypothetical protein [Bacteroidota bacterium]
MKKDTYVVADSEYFKPILGAKILTRARRVRGKIALDPMGDVLKKMYKYICAPFVGTCDMIMERSWAVDKVLFAGEKFFTVVGAIEMFAKAGVGGDRKFAAARGTSVELSRRRKLGQPRSERAASLAAR